MLLFKKRGMVEKWDPCPETLGTSRTPETLRTHQVTLRSLVTSGHVASPRSPWFSLDALGPLRPFCNLWDPAESLRTLRISLGPAWDHHYSLGCDA